MKKPTVDDLLAESAPAYAPSVATEAALDALVFETRDSTPATSRRRRPMWLLPTVLLGAGALTAGAAVVVDQYLHVDVPIPIAYTTDTGVDVQCTAIINGGTFFSPKPAEIMNYYKTHDFSGTGQQVYDYALVLTGDRAGTTDVLPNSVAWLPDEDFEPYSDKSALSNSLVNFLLVDVVLEFDLGGISGGADLWSDCEQLH